MKTTTLMTHLLLAFLCLTCACSSTQTDLVDTAVGAYTDPGKILIVDRIQKYDVVFIGFPTWGMQLPPPMKSFLKQYDLSGKTVIPFNTNGGYGLGSTLRTVAELSPYSKILEGYTTRGGLERDGQLLMIKEEKAKQTETEVKNWLQKLKMI